jgi:hypothetical protein
MTRKGAPQLGGLWKVAAALKGEPSIMLDVTIWAMREAERMADMRGAGRDVPIRDIGILNLCSMAVLGKEVVIMWPVRMLLSKLDLAQHRSTKRQLRWRTHVVRLLPLILRRKTGYRRQERWWILTCRSQRCSRMKRWEKQRWMKADLEELMINPFVFGVTSLAMAS